MAHAYDVWNDTDNIPASFYSLPSVPKAKEWIANRRKGYEAQGYYRDNQWNKIKPEDIQYRIIKRY